MQSFRVAHKTFILYYDRTIFLKSHLGEYQIGVEFLSQALAC